MLWTILAEGGVPMQEASLCQEHFLEDADACLVAAEGADDFVSAEWVKISDKHARNNDIECCTCKAIRWIDAQQNGGNK